MRSLLLAAIALWAFSVQSVASPAQDPLSVLEGVSHIQWQLTPAEAISQLKNEPNVVWVGRVVELVASRKPNGETVLDFYCAFIPLQNPSPEGLAEPIATKPETEQVFLVSIRSPAMPIEQANKLSVELKEKPHFAVASGSPIQLTRYNNREVVQIGVHKVIFSDKLVLKVMPNANASAAQPIIPPDAAR